MSAEQQTDGPKELTTEEHAAQVGAVRDALSGEQLVNRPLDRNFVIGALQTLTDAVHHMFNRQQAPADPGFAEASADAGADAPASAPADRVEV